MVKLFTQIGFILNQSITLLNSFSQYLTKNQIWMLAIQTGSSQFAKLKLSNCPGLLIAALINVK